MNFIYVFLIHISYKKNIILHSPNGGYSGCDYVAMPTSLAVPYTNIF